MRVNRLLVTALSLAIPLLGSVAAHADLKDFTLQRYIPDDVLVCVVERHNPEREFVDAYWGRVGDALAASGICNDVFDLVGSFLNEQQRAEAGRLKERAINLFQAVNWGELGARESAFAERLHVTVDPGRNIYMTPPDIVLMFRSGDKAEHNFDALAAILAALVEEVNKLANNELLIVDHTKSGLARIDRVNLLGMVPGAPALRLAVALHGEIVLLSFGDTMLNDTLELLDGKGGKRPISDDPRFRSALSKLPPPEDQITFFSMGGVTGPMQKLFAAVGERIQAPGDVYLNAGMSDEAGQYHSKGLAAYRMKNYADALRFTQQAFELDSDNCLILYNLACFNALTGNRKEALDWLERAVKGGFLAPEKIASDSDLNSLRDDARYVAALAAAREGASGQSVKDVVINSARSGEAHKLGMQAWQVYETKDYARCLQLVEQAYAVAPNDSQIMYYLASFHALLGNTPKALDFLEKAVEGGFYSPGRITNDANLKSLHDDRRYEAAVQLARRKASGVEREKSGGEAELWSRVSGRILSAVGILDYSAGVSYTQEHSLYDDAVVVLADDARGQPIYGVFGNSGHLKEFDHFLPRETESFSVSAGIDLRALYQFVLDTVRSAGPIGEEALKQWAAIQEQIGLNVEQDVLSWIQGDSISVTLENGGGSVWMLKVADADAARKQLARGISALSENLPQLAASNPALGMLTMTASPVDDERLKGFEELALAIAPTEGLIWGVTDGYVVFGTSEDAVATCLATGGGKHAGIRQNARVMSELLLPEGPFISVSLTDQRRSGQEAADVVTMISGMSTMLTMAPLGPEFKQAVNKAARIIGKLGPVLRTIDFYKSSASWTTFDGQAWHTRSVTHYAAPEDKPNPPTASP